MTLVRPALLVMLMVAASLAAAMLKPTKRMADENDPLVLEEAVPKRFAEWILDPSVLPVTVSADVQQRLDALYDQTLSRTYVNPQGQQVMLSIAYGGDQSSDKTQVHRPEFCYVSQGFQISGGVESHIELPGGSLPLRRLQARLGARHEPITYWITVGDHATLPGLGRKLTQMRYGLTGKVPDGMLVRISSIDDNNERAYDLQDQFVREMLAAMATKERVRLAGH
jgi:EpsI family protein